MGSQEQPKGWASVTMAAKWVAVSPRTIRTWLKQGLRHVMVGRTLRISYTDLNAFMRSFERKSEANREVINSILKEVMADM